MMYDHDAAHAQRIEALRRANHVRDTRAAFKDAAHADPSWLTVIRALERGEAVIRVGTVEHVLDWQALTGGRVAHYLVAIPACGFIKARTAIVAAGVPRHRWERVTLGDLEREQARAIAVELRIMRRRLNSGYVRSCATKPRKTWQAPAA